MIEEFKKAKQEMNERFGEDTMKKYRDAYLTVRKRLIDGSHFGESISGTWTYIIVDDGKEGEYKIGISKNPKGRIKDFFTARPFCRLLMLHKCNLERMLHKKYEHKRISGEWFKLDEEDLNDLICDYGFRYAPNIFSDGFEVNSLYCVQETELPKLKSGKRFRHSDYTEYKEFYLLWKQTPCNGLTRQCDIANEKGLRTPSGHLWKVPFARDAMNIYMEANNLTQNDLYHE